jgi:amidase/aspartyl-tRNA(Asn)/glutamyl-tRNA(Gln) amidotransferase subunit A
MHTSHPATRSAAELSASFASGELTPSSVLEHTLASARVAGDEFNAIIHLEVDGARDAARASTERWRSGEPLGALDGVPISIKDSFHVKGMPRRHGSAAHVETISAIDSAPVQRVKDAGMVVFAKTTMPDFGLLGSGLSSAYGIVRNPWNPELTPGGSSSGAGALLAAGVGPLALGTDIAGSVRLPAAHCGLAALKPTQGRIAYAPASSIRSAGVMARTVDDLEALLTVVGRSDESDPMCLPGGYEIPSPARSLAGLSVAVVTDMGTGMRPEESALDAVAAASAVLAGHGATIHEVALDVDARDAEALQSLFAMRGVTELHGVTPAQRSLLHPRIAEWIEMAYGLSGLSYAHALERVDQAREKVRSRLAAYDLVLSVAIPVVAFPATEPAPIGAISTFDHAHFLAWFNQTGQPSGVVRAGVSAEGLPVGVQLAGRRFDDSLVLEAMRVIESATAAIAYPFIEVPIGPVTEAHPAEARA